VPSAAPGAARQPGTAPAPPARRLLASPVARHLVVLAAYLAAGIAATWPRASYLVDGRLPATRDAGAYVWGFWWLAHQVTHLGNPWFTRDIAAPVGAQLGYHALLPLEGVLMTPVTLAFGPSASYNLLSILAPGLLCYAMYRAARLWVRSQTAAVAAGGLYGLSSDLAWHAWYQINLAAGMVFLPLALEAAVRLRRRPGWRQAVVLGVVVAASLLTDQESAVMVMMLVAGALLPWLAGGLRAGARAGGRRLALTGLAVVVMLAVASPQLAAMLAEVRTAGSGYPEHTLAGYYVASGAYLPGMFTASPRVLELGLTALGPVSYQGDTGDGVLTYGLVLTVLAVAGLACSWRRRAAWLLAAGWLGSAALALGSVLWLGHHAYIPAAQQWAGVRVSEALPYTWFVRIPGLSGFREAGRLLMLGLVPASLLAGAAIDWLRYHVPVLLVPVLVLAALETGWAGNVGLGTMRTALPALDRPIAADHSGSLVVDVPFGVRGGVPLPGEGAAFDPEAQVLATADGHPRAVAYLSRLPTSTLAGIHRHAFYDGLLTAQGMPLAVSEMLTGTTSYQSLLAAARQDARRMHVGWVLVWRQSPDIRRYLARTGFRFDYRADGVDVYRPAYLGTGRQARTGASTRITAGSARD
jgi:hypothetical protein